MNILKNQLKKLKESFLLVKKKPFFIAFPTLVEIIGLFVMGFVGSFIMFRAIPYLEKFYELNMQSGLDPTAGDLPLFLQQSTEKLLLSSHIRWIFIQLIIALFILFVVFQSLNWFLATKCVYKKVNFKKYFLNFFMVSLLGFITLIIIGAAYISITVNLSMSNLMLLPIVNLLFRILILILVYFLLIGFSISWSYKLRKLCGKITSIGFKNFGMMLNFIFILIVFLFLRYFVNIFDLTVKIILEIFIVIPVIAFTRVYLTKYLEKV
jgi:hypothetical protein